MITVCSFSDRQYRLTFSEWMKAFQNFKHHSDEIINSPSAGTYVRHHFVLKRNLE